MPYKIKYGPTGKRNKHRNGQLRTAYIVVAFMIIVVALRLAGIGDPLFHILLPGEPDVTAAALDQFVSDLKNGDQFTVAYSNFCREILAHAKIY